MAKLKKGKEEIGYLLAKVIEKYKMDTGDEVVLNTNRKNYESLAIFLSNISNQLPEKQLEWETDEYTPEASSRSSLQYPYRKFDITGGQIKDALSGIVSSPRPFLIDACYVYLYGKGRKGFEKEPTDDNLIDHDIKTSPKSTDVHENETQVLKNQFEKANQKVKSNKRIIALLTCFSAILVAGNIYFYFQNRNNLNFFNGLKTDMSLLPYQPSPQEIDSLEGIWLCYTGSPQARVSHSNRYHKVVSNLVEVNYKEGYFIYNRYGASFDHIGYMQMESPGIVSIYSRIKNKSGDIESPRHSLMNLNSNQQYIPVISASWNFDAGDKNRIIGIREVYQKLGKGGIVQEIINQVENASCQCKIIKWTKPDKTVDVFHLKNEQLETIKPITIQPLIDEKSILLNDLDSTIVLKGDTSNHTGK